MPARKIRRELPALKVKQWLPRWDRFDFSVAGKRRKPLPYFFMFSMNAHQLRLLSGVNRRARNSVGFDSGVQRRHEEGRSLEIGRYIRSGYPFSILSEARREEPENEILRKPGWLPTAVVVNILGPGDRRQGRRVAEPDLVRPVVRSDGACSIQLPVAFDRDDWKLSEYPPLEIIDGQHRLFAFDPKASEEDFDLPVVAFFELDIAWQAYLFWIINIKPKKINPSLAYDLYPLLRTQDWLETSDQFGVYRETRAQELVELLWSHPKSAWYQRIDMTGERGRGTLSQASFVRSLLATIIKRWEGRGVSIGGLFGGPLPDSDDPLGWGRVQQGAFVILFWQLLRDAVMESKARWAVAMRAGEGEDRISDAAFFGRGTLLNQDQGVRVVLHVLNDLTFLLSGALKLQDWTFSEEGDPGDIEVVTSAIASLRRQPVARYCANLATELATFDWRSANAPGLTEKQRRQKLAYRGSGGYRALRIDLLAHLGRAKNAAIRNAAKKTQIKMRSERT